ncbi:MAG: DNA-binding protein [Roseateles sp.]
MKTAIYQGSEVREAEAAAPFPPLELENRPTVATDQAAYYLARQQQTLRGWACREDGPLRPLRVHGRLAWPTAEIRRLLGVA